MWRNIMKDDIKRGAVIQVWDDYPYGCATVIKVRDGYATLARPYAYAQKEFDTKSPLMSCEVYEVSLDNLCKEPKYKVFQGRDGITSMAVGA